MRSQHLSQEMKSIFVLFFVFSLLLVANLSYARKDLGDYWKDMMNGQPMPEAIKDLLVEDPQVSDAGKDHFIRDFDIKPNIILYHTHTGSKMQKQREKQQAFVTLNQSSKKQKDMVEQTIKKIKLKTFAHD